MRPPRDLLGTIHKPRTPGGLFSRLKQKFATVTNTNALLQTMQNAHLKHFPKPTKRIGTVSMNGAVFASNNPKYVIKVVPQQAKREAVIQKLLSNHGIAPKLYTSKMIPIRKNRIRSIFGARSPTKDPVTLMLMNHMGRYGRFESAKNYFNKYPKNFNTARMVRNKMKQMHNLGIHHGDFHADNFYIIRDSNGKVKDVLIIDYGRADILPRHLRTNSLKNTVNHMLSGRIEVNDPRFGTVFYKNDKNEAPIRTNARMARMLPRPIHKRKRYAYY